MQIAITKWNVVMRIILEIYENDIVFILFENVLNASLIYRSNQLSTHIKSIIIKKPSNKVIKIFIQCKNS